MNESKLDAYQLDFVPYDSNKYSREIPLGVDDKEESGVRESLRGRR